MTSTLYPRILEPPKGSFFLFGPRGTGKSTWIRMRFADAYRIDLLNESLFQSYLADIGRFAVELGGIESGQTVVVDEVQRLPSLLNEVHRNIEERSMRFILCGSSARKLKTSGTNMLAGRAAQRVMHPFLPEELGSKFDLEQALRWGTLPVVWAAADRRDALEAYAQLYLREEIQAEALVHNLPGFARFLPVAALFHGQVLNVASVARDAGVARNTVSGYLQILQDTLLAFTLPAYQARLRVREQKHPKLYWVDPGLPRAMKRQLGPVTAEERGALFEGWVATLLRAYRDHRRLFDEWFYWAPGKGSGIEVDFVLQRGKDLIGIEAKTSRQFSEAAVKGLRALEGLPNLRRRILVYLGERPGKTRDGIEIMPVRNLVHLIETGSLFARS